MPSRNSSKSTSRPSPSRSAIMLKIVGFLLSKPSDCMADFNSRGSILPVASVSNRLKAYLSSSISSSVSPGLSTFFPLTAGLTPGLGLYAIQQILIKYKHQSFHLYKQKNNAASFSFLFYYFIILHNHMLDHIITLQLLFGDNLMNFYNDAPIDSLIGQLLAFVIMFEKKIEQVKCKLAGNQQFHTRVAFQMFDINRRNQISCDNMAHVMRNATFIEQPNCYEHFFRRYSKNGVLTYDEFLKIVTPKSNKTLTQRMLIRTYPKGAVLEDYLQRALLDMLALYIKLTAVSQNLRTRIQQSEDLNQLQLIEFFRRTITNGYSLCSFLQRCSSSGEQYDVELQDIVYLSYHIQSCNDLQDFTDIDIKELLCPLDLNPYTKNNITRQTFYVQSKFPAAEEVSTKTFYKTQTANFLGKTYTKMYDKTMIVSRPLQPKKENKPQPITQVDKYSIINTNKPTDRNSYVDNNNNYGTLFIDNFARSGVNRTLQLDNLIGNQMMSRNSYEVFHDDLNSNSSSVSRMSKESAFDRS